MDLLVTKGYPIGPEPDNCTGVGHMYPKSWVKDRKVVVECFVSSYWPDLVGLSNQ